MVPQASHQDVGLIQSSNEFGVNRPLPALSSPSSPTLSDQAIPHSFPSPTLPSARSEPRDVINRHAHTTTNRRAERSESPASTASQPLSNCDQRERETIIQSFKPHVVIHASSDVEELIADKGLNGGLTTLLRPFGERIQGKVVIRDSHGISRAWDDFSIRIRRPEYSSPLCAEDGAANSRNGLDGSRGDGHMADVVSQIDWAAILDLDLKNSEASSRLTDRRPEAPPSTACQGLLARAYQNYLQKLLSNDSVVPFETFNHPVACLVVVSSRNEAPIETLRELYGLTGRANPAIPAWISTEYLRYYVLIHDEDRDDILKSAALFDHMKRHFGLHCHLLRLRSSRCAFTDDDSIRLPALGWLSAAESQKTLQQEESTEAFEDDENSVFESDANAIIAFLRELVTQSIVPFMENRMTAWNDQVASRKRGIGGRFMSISKRWAGFGSLKSSGSTSGSSTNTNSSNYDADLGFYGPETPEAIMRSLADHAMMLRDWKLAYNTYDLMRSDFNHDKAWAYYAAANEMTATSALLLAPQQLKLRLESLDQWLDAAVYSYLTRCFLPTKAKRCLVLCTELLHRRDLASAERAPGWAARLFEISVLGFTEQCLISERIAHSYSTKPDGTTHNRFPRHAAMWTFIASLSCAQLGRRLRAQSQLLEARDFYLGSSNGESTMPFPGMDHLWEDLSAELGLTHGRSVSIMEQLQNTDDEGSLHPGQVREDTFVIDNKSQSRRTSHFARKSETIDTRKFAKLGVQNDGFE